MKQWKKWLEFLFDVAFLGSGSVRSTYALHPSLNLATTVLRTELQHEGNDFMPLKEFNDKFPPKVFWVDNVDLTFQRTRKFGNLMIFIPFVR